MVRFRRKHPFANQRGITLVEVMVVVAILGTLATIAVPNFKRMESKANYAGTMSLLLGIQAVVMGERPVERKTLVELTTQLCLFCVQNIMPGNNLEGLTPPWTPEIAGDWAVLGYSQQPRDMWGTPLIADLNEMEFGETDCRHDAVWSPGDNHVWDGVGPDGGSAVGDDLVLTIPFYRQTSARCPN